jgi:hypothetical protein
MCADRRGLSLAEVLVAAALALLLLTCFLWFLLPSLSAMARSTAQSEAQQQGVLALERIERELRRSAASGVAVFPKPAAAPGLYLTPLQDVNDKGQPNWALELVAVWWNRSQQRLWIKSWPPKDPPALAQDPVLSRPARLSAANYQDLVSRQNGTERSLAAGVIDFDPQHAGGSGSTLVGPLHVQIELERQEGRHKQRFKFRKVFGLRTE